jgi:hypothetical protein
MFTRVYRFLAPLVLSLAVASLTISAAAQPYSTSSATQPSAASVADSIGQLIEKGQAFEVSGRWAEALSHYEEALRVHPNDTQLTGKFRGSLHIGLKD